MINMPISAPINSQTLVLALVLSKSLLKIIFGSVRSSKAGFSLGKSEL